MRELWISPSKIDRFRAYTVGDYNGAISKNDVIESIKGTAPYTPKANFGTAYHAIIEHGPDRFYDESTGKYIVQINDMPDKVILHPKEVNPALKYRNGYPHLRFERWVFHNMIVDNYKVLLLMKVDGIDGLIIHENKTSNFMPFKESLEENYFKSIQWKIYLEVLNANYVQYNHFYYSEKEDQEYKDVEYNTWKLYRYKGIKQDIIDWIYGLIRFSEQNDLIDYLDKSTRKSKLGIQ